MTLARTARPPALCGLRAAARRALPALAYAGVLTAGPALAQQEEPPGKALKVCTDPNNLPFSNDKAEGFENKLAELFAKDLGLPLSYYSFPNRLAFIRNTLRYKLPGEDYRCDIVMGVPAGFEQVAATKPYYRSTYALVFAKGNGMDQVKSQQDLLALPKDKLKSLRIGLIDRTPATQWLVKHDLVDNGVPYRMLDADPDYYPGQIVERDLVGGKIDAAIMWGPIAGFFAKRVKERELVVVPLQSEPGVRFDYAMAMGVRRGEPKWKEQVESFISRRQGEIHAILREYGVPLVQESAASPAR